MADRIKGITVEIAGDTTKLNDALRNTDKEITNTQKQLKDVERLLKMDPGNTELVAQKQRLLAEAVEQTSGRLETLKQAESQAQEQFKRGEISREQYEGLQREIIATEQRLESLKDAAKESNSQLEEVAEAAKKIGDAAGTVADKTRTMSTVATGALGAVAAGAGKVVDEFADYEQLVGGVETLFKDAAGAVEGYAENAFRSAGLSANEYMETVTGFSASLIQSLGGDTKKAAEYADKAITDMSDNANKMGTDMSLIQNAYQGFAKQNYTMLDNLKLGYGGTKEEMQRLLADASKLAGVEFSIDSYADVIEAIHVMQESMGIAGATAKEAETTISGSMGAAKSAISNLVAGLGRSDADIDKLMQDVVESVKTMVANIIPALQNLWNNIPDTAKIALGVTALIAAISPVASIIQGITSVVSVATTVISTISGAMAIFTGAATTGTAAATGLAGALTFITGPAGIVIAIIGAVIAAVVLLWNNCEGFRTAVTTAWEAIKAAFQTFIDWLQATFAPVWDAVVGALQAVFDAFKQALAIAWQNIQVIFEMFGTFLQEVFGVTWSDVFAGIQTVIQTVGSVIQTVVQTVTNIFRGLINFLTASFLTAWQTGWQNAVNFFSAFKDSVLQIINGVKTAFQGVIDFVTGVFTGDWQRAWEGVKNIFKGVFDALVGIVKIPLNGIIGLLNKAIGAINFLIDGLNKVVGLINALGGNIPTIPHIPTIAYLAKGGTLEAGSAVVGENGPELLSLLNGKARVTPLASSEGSGGTRDDRAAAAGYNQTLNFYTAAMTPSEVARQTRNATRKMIAGVSG